MINKIIILVAFVCSMITFGCRSLSSENQVPLLSIRELGAYALPSSFSDLSITISMNTNAVGSTWEEDELLLSVHNKEGEELANCPFLSSYGKFELDVIDLDNDSSPEFVLITGNGRGTSCRSELLSVYRLLDNSLLDFVSATSLSGWAGNSLMWNYSYFYSDMDGNGTLDIVLELEEVPEVKSWQGNMAWIPVEKSKILFWNASINSDSHSVSHYVENDKQLEKKLKSIVIPEFTIGPPATMTDVVDFIQDASRDYDDPSVPVQQRGVGLILKLSDDQSEEIDERKNSLSKSIHDEIPVTSYISVKFISLYDALSLVCDLNDYEFHLREGRIIIVPMKNEKP